MSVFNVVIKSTNYDTFVLFKTFYDDQNVSDSSLSDWKIIDPSHFIWVSSVLMSQTIANTQSRIFLSFLLCRPACIKNKQI